MSRGRIYIEPRLNEERLGRHDFVAVGLQALQDVLNFIEEAALIEGKLANPEFRASLIALRKRSRSAEAPSFREVCSTASKILGVDKSKMLQILEDYESACKGCSDELGKAFDKALRKTRGNTSGSKQRRRITESHPSCSFDPSNIVEKSAYSISVPFYNSVVPARIWDVVYWLGRVAKLRSDFHKSADALARLKWFEATVADALMRLAHGCNHKEGVWKVFDTLGIYLSRGMKEAIVKQVEGDIYEFGRRRRHEENWDFDQKVCDDARKRWADEWAFRFAEELGSRAQGIARYERNQFNKPEVAGMLSSVERWIRQNSSYGVEQASQEYLGPHGELMKALEAECRNAWYRDIGWALRRFRRRGRELLDESYRGHSSFSYLNRADTFQTSVETLESDLLKLGLRFKEPVMKLIIENLTKDDSYSLSHQPFQVVTPLVALHAASHVKAVFGPLEPSKDRKRPHN